MANEIRTKTHANGITFADHAGDFAPAAGTSFELGTPTDVQLALANIANGSARQSAKVDLGATRATRYSVEASLEFFSAPTVGNVVEIYWSPSPSATAGNANPGGCSGTDSAYTGDGGGTVAETVRQLQLVGFFVCTDLIGVQEATVNSEFRPQHRYGSLVVVNNSGVALAATDDVETHIVFAPIVDEIQ